MMLVLRVCEDHPDSQTNRFPDLPLVVARFTPSGLDDILRLHAMWCFCEQRIILQVSHAFPEFSCSAVVGAKVQVWVRNH